MSEQCRACMVSGGQCDLDEGHSGEHQKSYGPTTYRWTDQEQIDLIERHGGTKGT